MKHLALGPRMLILAGAFLFFTATAQKGIGIAPPRFEIITDISSLTTEIVGVFSQNVPDQTINVEIVDWWIDPSGTVRELPLGTNPYSAAQWLKLNTDPFNLASDSTHSIRFSIDLTKSNSPEGSYWTAIAFTTKPRPAKNDRGLAVLLRTRIMAIIYVTIQGTEKPASELQGISIETDEGDKRFVIADVVNKGNVYLRLNGELRFVNAKGDVVRRTPLPERVLLRDGLVRYRLQVPEDLPEDVVLAAIEIQPQGPAKSYGGPPLYGETAMR